jgi:hypothetical protein
MSRGSVWIVAGDLLHQFSAMNADITAIRVVTGEEAANLALRDGWVYLDSVVTGNLVKIILGRPKGRVVAKSGALEAPSSPDPKQ